MTALPPLAQIPPEIRTLADYEARAQAHLSPAVWRHLQSGAGAEHSLVANRTQFDGYRLLPTLLADLRGGSTAIELFGHRHASPLMLAPLAYHRLAHPQGEAATAAAATALDTTLIVSTLASQPLEEIAATATDAATSLGKPSPAPLWFQLYFQPDRQTSLRLVRRAEAAGYKALVATVDATIKRADFQLPPGVEAANLRDAPPRPQQSSATDHHILFGTDLANTAPTWGDIAWLRTQTRLPIVLKGVLSPADARRAIDHGLDGLIVSNHGGRVIDGLISPLQALPAIVEASGQTPVLIDSGFRTGTDIVKALALGARAVLIGRPQLHALAVAGMPGVAHMLHILRAELELAMAQLGCPTTQALGPHILHRS